MEIDDNILYALIAVLILLFSRFLYVEIFTSPKCVRFSTQNTVNDESIVDIPDNNDENMNCNGDKCYV